MYYFIPAGMDRRTDFGRRPLIPWYRIRQKIEFDDSLHQIRISRMRI